MKKHFRILAVFLIVFMVLPLSLSAHSGRTDSSGGHHDYENVSGLGTYHYHHGYGPHLHPNGICPYDNSTSSAQANTPPGNIKIFINETPVEGTGIIIGDKTYIPLREVLETLGCEVNWDVSTRSVVISTPNHYLDNTSGDISKVMITGQSSSVNEVFSTILFTVVNTDAYNHDITVQVQYADELFNPIHTEEYQIGNLLPGQMNSGEVTTLQSAVPYTYYRLKIIENIG